MHTESVHEPLRAGPNESPLEPQTELPVPPVRELIRELAAIEDLLREESAAQRAGLPGCARTVRHLNGRARRIIQLLRS